MPLTYFKRYRMEVDLRRWETPSEALPPGYRLVPWDASLVRAHADVKFRCFCHELDANVFPALGHRDGCRRLMSEIAHKEGFLGEATWLIAHTVDDQPVDYCGTIQGVGEEQKLGWIQNIGITPEHRGRGLGSVLIARSLEGFRQAGLPRVYLEVTAQNDDAIRLYRRLGFAKAKVLYKTAEVIDV